MRLRLRHFGSISIQPSNSDPSIVSANENGVIAQVTEESSEETLDESTNSSQSSQNNDPQVGSNDDESSTSDPDEGDDSDSPPSVPALPPATSAVSISLNDTNGLEDMLSGVMTVQKALLEDDIEGYRLYWGSDVDAKANDTAITQWTKTGSHLSYTFSAVAIPSGATHFLVYSYNDAGEVLIPVSTAISDSVMAASLSYSATSFQESDPPNDGSIDTTIELTVSDGTLSADPWTPGTDYEIFGGNVPSGLTLSLTRDSNTQITIAFTGNADSHQGSDDTQFSIRWMHTMFETGGAEYVVSEQAFNVNFTSGTTKVEFDYTGTDQTFTVPAGVTEIQVRVWGAGGGGYSQMAAVNLTTMRGGGGGFALDFIATTPGEDLTVRVGEGANTAGAYAFGGGGRSRYNASTYLGYGGGGGSYLFRGDTLLTAAGGGGGAETAFGCGTNGGAGGGLSGLNGTTGTTGEYCSPGSGGLGGTQSAGGSGWQAGSYLQGGDGQAGNWSTVAGGGGGSGFVTSEDGVLTTGSGTTPGNADHEDRDGAGGGGGYYEGGNLGKAGNGRIVIYYSEP